jgi:hypothetical protein
MKLAKLVREYLNESNSNCLPEGYFADAARKDLIDAYLKNIENDDLLLEPDHYDGYEYQTYIQYIDNDTFKFYEGFSKLCWGGFKKQKQYKGKSEKDIIKDFINNRAKNLGIEFGYELVDSEYFIHQSWDYEDYILILTYKK